MIPTPWVTTDHERRALEASLTECRRRLEHFRTIGDVLQASMTEADLNRILEELQRIYRRVRLRETAK